MGGEENGISIRQMRLKVLYTFDNENKTNCLTRWPHILDIQTAKLDEETQIGLIELRTCIQAIVSASPELVAKLGQDYTVYAYDYTEYETPLVGQGMLSWVLASASPTPDAPAHQSKTIVTGRVCKNVLGLFSKGAQETLEVKLRLVPVPTVLQGEYLRSMQRYREMNNSMSQEMNTSSFSGLIQSSTSQTAGSNTPHSADRPSSPVDRSGIEKMHEILSECSTPREFPCMPPEPFRAASPSQSQATHGPPSRMSTPGLMRSDSQHNRSNSESFRPSSRGSAREVDLQQAPSYLVRRGSTQSGYGTDEGFDQPARKRAKVFSADWPGKSDMNIEKQPGSLRVAASTAASVRIHRPTPVNPALLQQGSNEEPVRPPTPIPRHTNEMNRRSRPAQSSLYRESSSQLSASQSASSYQSTDDQQTRETSATSPEDVRFGPMSETPFHMPSSPPVMDNIYPQPSSPGLPTFNTDHDSGFMSGGIECLLDDGNQNGIDLCAELGDAQAKDGQTQPTQETSPLIQPRVPTNPQNYLPSDTFPESAAQENAPQLPPPARKQSIASRPSSRPSSRAGVKSTVKPLAPAAISQSELDKLIRTNPPSDPPFSHPQQWSGNMSDVPVPVASTPAPIPPPSSETKVRSGAGARRSKQVQARLDSCIREGTVPPYCENCGAIETPTWRRAWSKVIDGNAEDAEEHTKDPTMLFWESVEKNDNGKVTVFKVVKKSLRDEDKDFHLVLLCNPCGLWLQKTKTMRPENKWNKTKDKRKRRARGALPVVGAATRSQKKAGRGPKRMESSPGPTEASSPGGVDGATPDNGNGNETGNDEESQPPSKKRRANSVEPRKSSDTAQSRWEGNDANEALRRAIQSSPARNAASRKGPGDTDLTPKPVNRLLFPTPNKSPMKSIGNSIVNSIRKSPRSGSHRSPEAVLDKENCPPESPRNDNLDHLFDDDDDPHAELEPPSSPTPKRRVAPLGSSVMMRPSALATVSPSPGNQESGAVLQSEADVPTSPTARLTAEELQRPGREMPGMSADEYRLSNLMDARTSPATSTQNETRKEVIDGVVMDIFESDDDASVAQTESNYSLAAPKGPSGASWAEWIDRNYTPDENDEDPEERKKRKQQDAELFEIDTEGHGIGNPQDISGDSLDEFFASNSDLMGSAMPDKGFGPIIFEDSTAQPSGHEGFDHSMLPDLDFFDPELVDPALMDLGEQGEGTNGEGAAAGGIDHAALSALLQEVNAQNSAAAASSK
ncbi:hypothetical protein FQN54_006930 [Arachnomyces sp. PD_36]|nr:hypothetical protein FQN54_006930 [Arachnomyces sp. PD_36]